MKLVDILARELKVWPEKSVAAVQQNSTDDRVSFVDCMDVEFSMGQWDYSEPCMRIHEQKESHEFERADDWKTAIVTRAEWQAAVDALKVAEGIADAEAGNLIQLDDVKSKYVEYSPAMHAQRVGRVTRVVAWDGKGLPPVGTVCEFDGFNPEETLTTDPRVGDQVTVIAHFKSGEFDLAAFTFHAPPEFNYLQVSQGAYGCFRPIRTPEQIEAEKRDGAVSEMVDNLKRYNSIHEACGMLYDAGYRKQLAP